MTFVRRSKSTFASAGGLAGKICPSTRSAEPRHGEGLWGKRFLWGCRDNHNFVGSYTHLAGDLERGNEAELAEMRCE